MLTKNTRNIHIRHTDGKAKPSSLVPGDDHLGGFETVLKPDWDAKQAGNW